ncbi:diguanylate cyclase [Desulfosporosinus sp.]|uniref:GGDEF domain-containing response regulator n=1 Tax=Desulfosporosinus sp. TaxID=157907 RepID=UPI0025C1E317|nr:diguanylate cyclase [Desulfosporosinus sp.]MBC2726680.1 diguanylate cyclase [Desulfosporosinus sp.]
MIERVKLLIVDDLKENHLVMESVLSDPDLDIIKAMSGEEALSLCLEHDFAVIFMDVQMPGMDGFEVAELLRSIEKTKSIPIIFVTAISKEQKSIFKGYEVGAVDYLSKPIDPIVLRSKARIFKELYLQRITIQKQLVELEERLKELTKMQQEKDSLESLSLQDGLTKIYNRRGLDKFFNIHWSNCLRYRLPYSVMMIDIDEFKNYNDNYGHLQGDEVIKAVASAIKKSLFRSEDLVGRYGGEEFLVVMPNVDIEGAEIVAKRIQNELWELNIKHEFASGRGRVTVSIGVAALIPSHSINPQELIDQADQKMYVAKKNGRNQFVSNRCQP